jgi:hypothetical protein
MFKSCLFGITLALAAAAAQAQFADAVIDYSPGTGFIPGFTNQAAALGEPSRNVPGEFGGPVDPFAPPYLPSQLLSVGAGGSVTLKFSRPVRNHPANRFGIDFILFGNTGFIITNAFDPVTFEWIGTPATDGALFGANPGQTRVSISRDGSVFYELDPALAPIVDGLFPTDGVGDFHVPADPTLTQADFAGLSVADIRTLYLGSAGGSGYDISWARDAGGRAVRLPDISYVRIEVLAGKSELDGAAAVFVPPGLLR